MNRYGKAAVKSAELLRSRKDKLTPRQAWELAAREVLGDQAGGCPRSTFLGLCSEGLVKGVPAGRYTFSVSNKRYAVEAVSKLREMPQLSEDKDALWNAIDRRPEYRNNQMEIVVALWEKGLIE